MNFHEFVKIRKMMRLVNQNDGVRLIVATCFDSMASLNKSQQVAAKKKQHKCNLAQGEYARVPAFSAHTQAHPFTQAHTRVHS